jgi:NADPH2:quinone reductase
MRAVGLYKYLPIEDPESLVDLDVPKPEPRGRDPAHSLNRGRL